MNSDFTPAVWPEEKAPLEFINYEQCEVCTQKSRIIWGHKTDAAESSSSSYV